MALAIVHLVQLVLIVLWQHVQGTVSLVVRASTICVCANLGGLDLIAHFEDVLGIAMIMEYASTAPVYASLNSKGPIVASQCAKMAAQTTDCVSMALAGVNQALGASTVARKHVRAAVEPRPGAIMARVNVTPSILAMSARLMMGSGTSPSSVPSTACTVALANVHTHTQAKALALLVAAIFNARESAFLCASEPSRPPMVPFP